MTGAIAAVMLLPMTLFARRDLETLAADLAHDSRSAQAIEAIVSEPDAILPTLLKWTKNPPKNVNVLQLDIALMAIFARLRTTEAIPFLVKHINDRRTPNSWLKTEDVILQRSPAIRTLLSIGPTAIRELRTAYKNDRTPPQDRIAVVFTLSMMRSPDSRDILEDAAGHTELISSVFARRGIMRLDGKDLPPQRSSIRHPN